MQQFQRATLVIMALELIRRWGNYELGKEPINIGLWVEDNSLPNKTLNRVNGIEKDSLKLEFEKLNNGAVNKIPFTNCPWCNSKLEAETNEDNENNTSVFLRNRLHLSCKSPKCSFYYPRRRT
jgi:uncharacterized protein with PIN domain